MYQERPCQALCFSIEKLGFSLINFVPHWKTGVFNRKPGFSTKNLFCFCFLAKKKTVFQIKLLNLFFRLARNPVFRSKNWVFRRKTGFCDLLDIKPAIHDVKFRHFQSITSPIYASSWLCSTSPVSRLMWYVSPAVPRCCPNDTMIPASLL